MTYRIDPSPLRDDTGIVRYQREATIVVVGCGGTGGFLAEAICRLLIGREANLYLVDPDCVEPHNVARQCFDRTDIGRSKSEVMGERLSRRFGREIAYSVLPYDRELHAQAFSDTGSRLNLLVGCVDNAAARRAIAATIDNCSWNFGASHGRVWWLDCGNGRYSGQILLGNTTRSEELRGAFLRDLEVCRALPAPSLQRPDLLEAPPEPRHVPDCAEAVARGDQGPTINQVVAAIAASYIEKLVAGTCVWMASYFDVETGALRCFSAEPKLVAQIANLHANAVAPPLRASTL